jgi:hypothetical protein
MTRRLDEIPSNTITNPRVSNKTITNPDVSNGTVTNPDVSAVPTETSGKTPPDHGKTAAA